MANTLQGIIEDAIEEVNEIDLDGAYPEDEIHEIADGAVPVYNSDLLELAAGNNDLALTEPELGPAFDGTPTPVNIIAANVYEAVSNACHERLRERQEEAEEAELEEETA